jgi:O-antigen/teichoic acid export membrane protein
MYLAREVARRPDAWRATFARVIRIRGALAYLALVVLVLTAGRIVPDEYRRAFAILVAASLTSAVLETVGHLFRGLDRSEIEAALQASQRLAGGLGAFYVLSSAPDLERLGWALLWPPAVALAISGLVASVLKGGRLGDVPALSWSRLLHDVFPLGAGAVVSALYFRCDIYFVERWHGLDAAGVYNAVFRLVEATRLLPAAVLAVTFPALCRARDRELVAKLSGRLTAAGGVLGALTAAAAPWIVVWAYGEPYRSASTTLSILGIAIPLFFLNYALTHQVIGWDGQRAYLAIAAVALAVNVLANLSLVPPLAANGAAAATVLTEIVVTLGCLFVLRSGAWVPAAPRASEGGR